MTRIETRHLSRGLAVTLALLLAASAAVATNIPTPARVQGGSQPEVILDDTTAGATDQEIESNANGATLTLDLEGQASPFATFTINAPQDSFFMDSSGDIGLGTSTPSQDLHVAGGQVQLFIPGGGGAWHLNPGGVGLFFINNDATSTVPVKFRNDSPDNQLVVAPEGVGVGTPLPQDLLHVSGGDARISDAVPILILDDTDTAGDDFHLRSSNAGGQQFSIQDVATGSSPVRIKTGSLTDAIIIDSTGVTLSSSRTVKTNIEPAAAETLLAALVELPIYTWSYASDGTDTLHVGPMAEDFHHRFGFGADEKRLSSIDTGGVALAAIQALHQELEKRDAEIAELRAAVELLLAERAE